VLGEKFLCAEDDKHNNRMKKLCNNFKNLLVQQLSLLIAFTNALRLSGAFSSKQIH
jgi:hypothetical protein